MSDVPGRDAPARHHHADDALVMRSFSEFVLASDGEPLPVELVSFEAVQQDNAAHLSWRAESRVRGGDILDYDRDCYRYRRREGSSDCIRRNSAPDTY